MSARTFRFLKLREDTHMVLQTRSVSAVSVLRMLCPSSLSLTTDQISPESHLVCPPSNLLSYRYTHTHTNSHRVKPVVSVKYVHLLRSLSNSWDDNCCMLILGGHVVFEWVICKVLIIGLQEQELSWEALLFSMWDHPGSSWESVWLDGSKSLLLLPRKKTAVKQWKQKHNTEQIRSNSRT